MAASRLKLVISNDEKVLTYLKWELPIGVFVTGTAPNDVVGGSTRE
jgi:hypothetical protein